MNTTTRGKRTLLAFSLSSLLAACGTVGDGNNSDGDNQNSNGNGTGSVSSTAGGYETRNPIGTSGQNTNTGRDFDTGQNGAASNNNSLGTTNVDSGSGGERPISFTINFALDSAEMSEEALGQLKEHAAYLRANPSLVVVVEGHADERGSREYNIGLGQRRAEAVRRLLLLEGVNKARIDTISFGEEKPLDFRHDEGAWATNRRAVFVYPQ